MCSSSSCRSWKKIESFEDGGFVQFPVESVIYGLPTITSCMNIKLVPRFADSPQ